MAFNSTPQDIIEQDINGLLDIHRSWIRVPLSLVCDVKNGFAFKSSSFNNQGEGERLIRIRDVLPGDTKTYYSGSVPDGYWVNPDDIVVGMDGDFNLAWWQSRPALLNQRVCRLDITSQSYIKRFFYRVLPGYIEAVNLNTSSTTVKHLSSKTLSDLLIPLPPLAEQKVIAEKLDTLLAQVENTKARLERIPQILKRFRQSVLAAAVSGRLTEEWRERVGLPEWQITVLGDVIGNIDQGWSPKCHNEPTADESWGVIKTSSVLPMAFAENENKKLPESLDVRPNLRVLGNDILTTRAGPRSRCGITCYVSSASKNLMICDKVYRYRVIEGKGSSKFLALQLNSPSVLEKIETLKTGISESGMNLTQKKFRQLELNWPTREEQTEIVRRVDQLFAHADRIEQQVNNALVRVNTLTQSNLAKAFRGELTEQWRKDNPELISGENSAEALLERIKSERAAQKPAGRQSKKKKSEMPAT